MDTAIYTGIGIAVACVLLIVGIGAKNLKSETTKKMSKTQEKRKKRNRR